MHDYVIVGGGTAGSVLAERLTASGRSKVALLEAGGKPSSLFVKMPAGMGKLFKSKLDWAFESEPMQAVGNRRVYIPRGKMLGGSANMNAQIHQWCHPADFDGWAELGATGWSWQDVAPVLRRMESWSGGDPGDERRGRSGPLRVAPLRAPNPLSLAFVQAARAAGLDGPADYNGGAFTGAWLSQVTQRNGRRFSAYDAYLKPAMKRPNLEVRRDAQALRILFEGTRASGVVLRRYGREETVRAARGVVLCAGAYGTPQLLQLSGIGPAEHLRSRGVEVVRDVAEVGAGLQEHPLLPISFGSRRPITLKNAERPRNLLTWLLFGRGMLSSNVPEAMAFASSDGGAAPDIELCFVPVEWRGEGLEPPQRHAWGCGVVLLTPRSRGTVRLASADPCAAPAIDLNMLSDPGGDDARVLLRGVELFRRIAATEPLASESTGELSPGPELRTCEQLIDYCARELQTTYHPVGTCRMGADDAAPVTPELRARGFAGLWVVDASVMPRVPRGHPNAVVAMIAERAAELVAA